MWFLQPGITFEYLFMRILAVFTIVFLILPFHEFAHAFVAYKLGDKTAKRLGRMTLSPLSHFDMIGALCIMLFGFGWAKPVPINTSNFKNPRRDMALVSLAGPAANFLAALCGGFVVNLLFALDVKNSFVYLFLMNYILINVGLTLFNLLPLYFLDGSKILEALIPENFLNNYHRFQSSIGFVIYLIIFLGFFSGPLSFLESEIYNFVVDITSFPFLMYR